MQGDSFGDTVVIVVVVKIKTITANLSTIRCLFVNCCTVIKTFFLKSCRSLKQFLSLAAEENPLLSSSRMSRVTSNLKTRLLIPVTIVEVSADDCCNCCFLFEKNKTKERFSDLISEGILASTKICNFKAIYVIIMGNYVSCLKLFNQFITRCLTDSLFLRRQQKPSLIILDV